MRPFPACLKRQAMWPCRRVRCETPPDFEFELLGNSWQFIANYWAAPGRVSLVVVEMLHSLRLFSMTFPRFLHNGTDIAQALLKGYRKAMQPLDL